MKKFFSTLFSLINFAAFAVWAYEIYFLVQNGTAGNVDNIVIVIVLTILFLIKFLVKAAANIIKWLFIIAILYTIASHVIPVLGIL